MDKDFEKWLKKDELFEYYNANPEQQAEIYKDYQREKEYIKTENIDGWVKWLCNNPELAEKHYPLLVNGLKKRIQNTEPFQVANIIQELPDHFPKWKTEAEKHFGIKRTKIIQGYIDLIKAVLIEYDYQTEIEQKAAESIRAELTEQLEYWESELKALSPQQNARVHSEQETPKTFEELFYNPAHAEACLKILNELQTPVIDAINNYIGKAKGIFPLWIKVLKNHKPKPLIKHFKDTVYKDLLNQKVKGLNLSKDASEFRKQYKRIEDNKVELDIKAILSQYSQSGKLGK
ncbi:hypothetical protein [Aestuariivivens sediminicola]|uniref:hypothetical protein n=1 Tax=Aestuariivivens sediminicola TaxID=2913560 RepID=UPI001F5659A8|nr:hypothetical protein [Aestuariivivens sediminicola]